MRGGDKNFTAKNLINRKSKNLLNWYETKYSLGGQRDIEFLEYFYIREKIYRKIENLDVKKLFLKKVKLFYFILDQFVNITFSMDKPRNLPNKVSKYLVSYLNLKDLGTLKQTVKDHKNQIRKNIEEILKL